MDNFLTEVLSYIDTLAEDGFWVKNVMQTSYWKGRIAKIELREDELALPLFIYNDDFEPLNVLGSHRGVYKLSGVYVSLPCLPPNVQSKLKYIFLAMSYDRSVYGNTRIFMPLIDQLNKLQTNGVPVNHGTYNRIKFIPLLIIGDNLGLNAILGFVECFRANFFCRFCHLPRDSLLTNTKEDAKALQNETIMLNIVHCPIIPKPESRKCLYGMNCFIFMSPSIDA